MFGKIGMFEIFMVPLTLGISFIIPAIALYFILKLAIKNAVRELKKDNLL